MDRLVQVSREQLEAKLRERFAQYMGRVMDAVNAAPDGKLIEGSEVQVHELMRQFEQEVYQTALQSRIDSTESSFSPSEGRIGQTQDKQRSRQREPADVAGTGGVVADAVVGRGRRKRGGDR